MSNLRSAFVFGLCACALGIAQNNPLLPENSVTRVSDHVSAIMGFPNIAIITGTKATLVVDTGMGPRNGAIVARAAQKLAKAPLLYLTTTHFHPEHAAGEQGFPPGTILIRPAAQQTEMDERGMNFIEMFRSRNAQNKELLADVKLRKPDILFDREHKLDLGGVTARLMWLGAGHTRGDELIFVEEDSVLISGDIVQNQVGPNIPDDGGSVKSWIAVLDKLEPLRPRIVFPDHSQPGDASLIAKERGFLVDLQTRALALKREGKSADEAAKIVQAELSAKYPAWGNLGGVANCVKRVYAEAP